MKLWVIFVFLFSAIQFTHAAPQDIYTFDNPQQVERFNNLMNELRCLVCQNQNLADSQAPLAEDLRQQIHQKIKQGKSDQEVINYLTERYGEYILYRPPFTIKTYVLWVGPFLLLLASLMVLIRKIKTNSTKFAEN